MVLAIIEDHTTITAIINNIIPFIYPPPHTIHLHLHDLQFEMNHPPLPQNTTLTNVLLIVIAAIIAIVVVIIIITVVIPFHNTINILLITYLVFIIPLCEFC